MNFAVGIDIGGTTTNLGAIDKNGQFHLKKTFKTNEQSSESMYFNTLIATIHEVIAKLRDQGKCLGIGVGAPSCNPKLGVIKKAVNLPFSDVVPIVKILNDEFQLPVTLVKDGNAAALGEGFFGGAKDMENYAVLTLGTGLGCGLVINGKVVAGSNGQAGELGHAVILKNGRKCNCGNKGCLETYVSATGIKRTLAEILSESNLESNLRSVPFENLNASNIYAAALNHDLIAKKSFEITGEILGRKLAELVTLFEPEAFFLAGGLAEAGEILFKPTIRSMENNLLHFYKKEIKVLPSFLKPNEAALLGSVSLLWQQQKTISHVL